MEFHQLRYFVTAAEELSFSRAASRLHVSQPALSRQIALLEGEIDVPLFDRIKKRIHLTEGGRFFLPKARQILCDAETSMQQLREQHGSAGRTIRLGFIAPFLDDLVVPALREFRRRNPKTKISLFDLAPRAQIERLKNRELDLALVGNIEESDRRQLTIKTLFRSPMAVVLPDDHRLAKSRSLSPASLRGESFVSLADLVFPGRGEFLRSVFRPHGFEPKVVLEVDSLAAMLGAVAAGEGIALVPSHAAKKPLSGCRFIPLQKPAPHAEALLVRNLETPARDTAELEASILKSAKNLG